MTAVQMLLYEARFEVTPPGVKWQRGIVFAVAFVLVVLVDLLVSWAWRRPGERHASVVVSFVTGLLSGLLTLTFWGAILAWPVAAIGIAAARRAWAREKRERGGQSVLNRVGLVLNVLAFGVGCLVLLILVTVMGR